MPDTDYLAKLKEYLKSAAVTTTHIPFTVRAVQHLAEGVTVVHDSLGDFDTFFDAEKWEPTMPEIWGDAMYPPVLKRRNMGVLLGNGQVPPIRSFNMALTYARQHLKPKKGFDLTLSAREDPKKEL